MNPLVSICTICYNQEKYIDECIRNVVGQQFDGCFEYIIGDDCSTDQTHKICEEWQERYPDLIRLLPNTKNLGMMANFFRVLGAAQGKYIAFCEGDDYWCDPKKLQKQVDYLEAHPECGLVYTQVQHYIQRQHRFDILWGGAEETSLESLLDSNSIPTPTVLFRRELWATYCSEIKPDEQNWQMGDYPLWLYIANRSKIHFMDQVTAIYRVLDCSASHFREYEKRVRFCQSSYELRLHFARLHRPDLIPMVQENMIWEQFHAAISYKKQKDAQEFNRLIRLKNINPRNADHQLLLRKFNRWQRRRKYCLILLCLVVILILAAIFSPYR